MRRIILTLVLAVVCYACGSEVSPYDETMEVITQTQQKAEKITTLAELQECQTYFNDKISAVSEKHKEWTGTEEQENQINESISLIYQLFEQRQMELGTDINEERTLDIDPEEAV